MDQETERNDMQHKISVEIKLTQDSVITDVTELDNSRNCVHLGRGLAPATGFQNGVIVDETAAGESLRQSLAVAEQNARVSIRRVSVKPPGDAEQLIRILNGMGLEICD